MSELDTLTVDGFPPGHFTVHSFTGRETISEPYAFDLVVTIGALLVLTSSCALPHAPVKGAPTKTPWDAVDVTVLAESRADDWADLRCPRVAVELVTRER